MAFVRKLRDREDEAPYSKSREQEFSKDELVQQRAEQDQQRENR